MQATPTATHVPPGSAAAAWVDLRHAMVARSAPDGSVEVVELRRPATVDEPVEQWLAVVAGRPPHPPPATPPPMVPRHRAR